MMRVLFVAAVLALAVFAAGCYAIVSPNVGVGIDVGPAEIYVVP
jgi:hypothetical protein